MDHYDAARIVAAVSAGNPEKLPFTHEQVMEAICVTLVEWAIGFQSLHDSMVSMSSEAGWTR